MDYVKLTERLIKALAKNEEAVTVKEFPSEDSLNELRLKF